MANNFIKTSMRGLVLRGNVFWLDVCIDGQRIRKSLGIPKQRKREAEKAVSEWWLAVAQGKLGIGAKNPSLLTLFENFLIFKKNSVTPDWHHAQKRYLHQALDALQITEFQEFEASKFMQWLLTLPSRTGRAIFLVVRGAFKYALGIDMIDLNPLQNTPVIKHKRISHEPLTEAEFIEFAKECTNYSACHLLLFLMKTGCRCNEGAKARWRQIDFERGIFHLSAEQTKNRKSRKIPLSTDICILLEKVQVGEIKKEDLIFMTSEKTAFKRDNIRRTVKSIGKKIGRPDLTTHSLRHSFTTLCREREDVSLSDMGKILGHSSDRITKIYAHDSLERERKIIEKLPSIAFMIG